MDKLAPIVIDLSKAKENKLDESFLVTFGWAVKKLLKAVLGDISLPVHLKGNPADVRSFVGALGAEKNYIKDYKNFGLDNPRTYKSKATLDTAVGKFERKTGIKWPFK
tara:strand:+ start:243 stop:566 length:324 start_codon:yes stop_codon:yes gene_type:complete